MIQLYCFTVNVSALSFEDNCHHSKQRFSIRRMEPKINWGPTHTPGGARFPRASIYSSISCEL